ncbi:MAG: tail fiber protein, partial [Chloroflexi bacterium]|nr:tail fiber protein [Chloroflexota bacterium]
VTADVNDLLLEHNGDGTHRAAALNPTGSLTAWPMKTPPAGWLLCDGGAVGRTTYPALFGVLCPLLGSPTLTLASPCVVTLNNHGLNVDDAFYFGTTGQLPTGVSPNTIYYVIAAGYDANNFQFSATRGGGAVNSSGSQSGLHSLTYCPYGLGDGATTFNVPDLRGRSLTGRGSHSDVDTLGKNDGLAAASRTPKHTHSTPSHTHSQNMGAVVGWTVGTAVVAAGANGNDMGTLSGTGGSSTRVQTGAAAGAVGATGTAGSGFVVVNYVIKT